MRKVPGITPDNPLMVRLSTVAKQRWGEFYNGNSEEQHELDFEAGRATFAKLPTYAARLALVLHVVAHLEVSESYDIPAEMSVQTLEAAIQLVDWFKGESMRLLLSFRSKSTSDPAAEAIIDAIQERGKVTKNELHSVRVFRNADKPAKAIDAKLVELLESGVIEPVPEVIAHTLGNKAYQFATPDSGSFGSNGSEPGSEG